MAQQRSGLASDAAREVARRARSFGQQLDGREPTELLDDLRSFARRRPGMFLAGSVVAGVVVGRFLRGSRDAAQTSSQTAQRVGQPARWADRRHRDPENRLGTSYDATMPAEAPIDRSPAASAPR